MIDTSIMTVEQRKAFERSYLGKTVEIGIDRPIGYIHTKGTKVLHYPINYGYIPDILGGDGEEMDVYLLGVSEPVEKFTCKIIAIVHREDDIEDKLVAAPEGLWFTAEQIASEIEFQEKYYTTYIELYNEQ